MVSINNRSLGAWGGDKVYRVNIVNQEIYNASYHIIHSIENHSISTTSLVREREDRLQCLVRAIDI